MSVWHEGKVLAALVIGRTSRAPIAIACIEPLERHNMSVAQQRPMTATEWALMLLLALLWGGSFFFVGVAVKQLPPLTIVAARVSMAAALLWLAAPLTGLLPRKLT